MGEWVIETTIGELKGLSQGSILRTSEWFRFQVFRPVVLRLTPRMQRRKLGERISASGKGKFAIGSPEAPVVI